MAKTDDTAALWERIDADMMGEAKEMAHSLKDDPGALLKHLEHNLTPQALALAQKALGFEG